MNTPVNPEYAAQILIDYVTKSKNEKEELNKRLNYEKEQSSQIIDRQLAVLREQRETIAKLEASNKQLNYEKGQSSQIIENQLDVISKQRETIMKLEKDKRELSELIERLKGTNELTAQPKPVDPIRKLVEDSGCGYIDEMVNFLRMLDIPTESDHKRIIDHMQQLRLIKVSSIRGLVTYFKEMGALPVDDVINGIGFIFESQQE